MATFNFPNATTPDDLLIGVSTTVPVIPILMLFFTWMFVFMGGASKQKNKTGSADLPQWSVLASLSTLLLSLVFTIKEGIITSDILIIVVSITILSGVWFFLSRGRYE